MARSDKPSSADVTDWHRLFGIVLTELFAGSDWEVIRELDLSIKQQLLDIVIVRRGRGPVHSQFPMAVPRNSRSARPGGPDRLRLHPLAALTPFMLHRIILAGFGLIR